jgi:hypothetical protein
MLIDESRTGMLQAGTRIAAASGPPPTSFVNVGAIIERGIHESGGRLLLEGAVDQTTPTPFQVEATVTKLR